MLINFHFYWSLRVSSYGYYGYHEQALADASAWALGATTPSLISPLAILNNLTVPIRIGRYRAALLPSGGGCYIYTWV